MQNDLPDDEAYVRKLYKRAFNDELWSLQWYEVRIVALSTQKRTCIIFDEMIFFRHQVGLESNSTSILDMNLLPVYKVYNITGDGVNVMIIDDGIEHTHEDLTNNFVSWTFEISDSTKFYNSPIIFQDPSISFNLNFNISDVTPRYEDPRNKHGTRCAGVVAMQANNKKCGVGIAYNAKVGGKRIWSKICQLVSIKRRRVLYSAGITLLDGVTNDLLEATAVTHALDKVHIYSGSWGPQDNGYSVDGPGRLTSAALLRGITQVSPSSCKYA